MFELRRAKTRKCCYSIWNEMMVNDSKEVLEAWETSSQYWNKHQAIIEQMFTPLSHALIEAAGIQAGQSVLDIGGGAGEPTLTIARVVGPSGSVTYTDPAAGMVASARDAATRRGITNASFHRAAAETLSFENDSFDAVVGRMSAMFFPDVVAGVRETLRVAKPSAPVSLLVWSRREANPFFSIVSDVLDRYVPPEPEDEDAPTAFRFAAPGKLANKMREAGAVEVKEQRLPFAIEAPVTVDQFWEMRSEMSDSFRKKLATLDSEQVAEMKKELTNAVSDYFTTGHMKFPGEVLIVTGRRHS